MGRIIDASGPTFRQDVERGLVDEARYERIRPLFLKFSPEARQRLLDMAVDDWCVRYSGIGSTVRRATIDIDVDVLGETRHVGATACPIGALLWWDGKLPKRAEVVVGEVRPAANLVPDLTMAAAALAGLVDDDASARSWADAVAWAMTGALPYAGWAYKKDAEAHGWPYQVGRVGVARPIDADDPDGNVFAIRVGRDDPRHGAAEDAIRANEFMVAWDEGALSPTELRWLCAD